MIGIVICLHCSLLQCVVIGFACIRIMWVVLHFIILVFNAKQESSSNKHYNSANMGQVNNYLHKLLLCVFIDHIIYSLPANIVLTNYYYLNTKLDFRLNQSSK